MSIKADLLARLNVKEGDDRRSLTFTVSDQVVTEQVWHVFTLSNSNALQIPTSLIGTYSGKRSVMLVTDKRIRLGRTSGATNTANDIPANGFYFSMLTATTALFLKTMSTATATVQVAIVRT